MINLGEINLHSEYPEKHGPIASRVEDDDPMTQRKRTLKDIIMMMLMMMVIMMMRSNMSKMMMMKGMMVSLLPGLTPRKRKRLLQPPSKTLWPSLISSIQILK